MNKKNDEFGFFNVKFHFTCNNIERMSVFLICFVEND